MSDELGALMGRARELQPRAFAPDEPPWLAGIRARSTGRDPEWQGHRRRRILAELLLELERARTSRAEWYVWVSEEWPVIKAGRNS